MRLAGLPSKHAYATEPGKQSDITLADGSRVTLGGDTRLTVRFTARERDIELTHGEALFKVQHEATRPFVVRASNGSIRAVGTEFDVRRYSNHVNVWVREGAVEYAPHAPRPAGPQTLVRIARGEEMTYDLNGRGAAKRFADPLTSGGWIDGTLGYHGRPLAEVIEDVQRYSKRPLVLDPSVASLRFSGFVSQQHIQEWLDGLPAIYPGVEVSKLDPGQVLIRRNASRP